MLRMTTSVAVGALLAGLAVPAQAQTDTNQQNRAAAGNQCQVINQQIEQQMASNPDMRAQYRGEVMRDLRSLRDAAQTLAAYGQTEACQSLADAIHEITQNPQRDDQAMPRSGSGQTASGNQQQAANQAGTQQQTSQTQRAQGQQQSGQAMRGEPTYERAQKVTGMQGQLRAENILGSDVRGTDDESIGEIDDVVLASDGQPTYAVVTYGGFLGLGEEALAVPFKMLRVSQNDDVYYLPLTEADLEEAPRFERGNFEWTEDDQWRAQNDDYFASFGDQNRSDAG